MAVSDNIPLENQLSELGFRKITKEVKAFVRAGAYEFSIPQIRNIANDSLLYVLQFENETSQTRFVNYELVLQSVKIPKEIIKGIDTGKLERKMIKADKLYNQYYQDERTASKEETALIESANKELNLLYESGDAGREVSQLLMFKFWPESNYKEFLPDATRLKENYEVQLPVTWINNYMLTADEAYKKAKELFEVPNIENMAKEHVISDALFETAQFEISFGRDWVAYNTVPYFLDTGDAYFFKDKDEATEFSANNISDYDSFKVIHVKSIQEFLNRIPYGERLNHLLRSDPDANGLHNKDGNEFTDALIDHFESQQLSIFNKQLNTNVMNNDNLQYLKDNIKYMGFGETLHGELEKNLREGKAEFQLHFKVEINKKPFDATLNFRKSDSTDMYFFNNYHASLEKSNGEKNEQTFYLNKGKGVTAKESYNLLDGRAVHKDLTTKEGQPYKAWIQLDFENKDKNNNNEVKQFHENYGYDLKAAVEKFAVAELNDAEKSKALFQSLEKGNVQSVTIEKDGSSHKMFMEADPQYKKVTLYDANMKMVAKESLGQYKAGIEKGSKEVKQGQENDKKKELKQEPKAEKAKLEKKNGQSLLPKKRESKGKGLGVS